MTTIGQDETAQAMAERDPLLQEVSIGETMARRCSTAALLAVLNERGFEAAPVAVGAAVSRVIDKARALEQEDATRWTTAQALFHDAVRTLLTTLCETDAERTPERTPETVLRAMLKAYERALDLFAQEALRTGTEHLYAERDYRVSRLRFVLARVVVYGALPEETCDDARLLEDYQQRLSGARELNAPPLEEP